MVGVGFSDDLLIGLILGCLIGLLAAPIVGAWLARREWKEASRGADAARAGDALEWGEELRPTTLPQARRRSEARKT